MRKIKGEIWGNCDVCLKNKPTVCLEAVERGYEGYDIEFNICKECAVKLIDDAVEKYNKERGDE